MWNIDEITLMSVPDFTQWDFFHVKTRSYDGMKPEGFAAGNMISRGKKEEEHTYTHSNG